jgi:ribulose-5-phosphate 4-epimerase/fuculose-1-phosphate aldolase
MAYLGVKFRAVIVDKTFPRHPDLDELKNWCTEFYNHGFTPEYEGGSAGNLSFRVNEKEDQFIITAAGIVSKSKILDNALCQVRSFNLDTEVVYYYGQRKPSSESLVHGVIYQARKDVSAVFHGHSDSIVKAAAKLGIVETKKEAVEGTKDLAKAVLEVLGNNNFIVLKNHGFISMGKTMKEAGEQAIKMQEKAMRL